MDNFKTLFERGEYELVIKATKNSSDVDDLFYCISAYLALGRLEEALQLVNDKFVILKTRLPLLMKTHIELLCLLKRFDEAYEKVEYYKNLPYFSQEAEETLSSLRDVIREYEKNASKILYKDDETLEKELLNNDPYTVLGALDALRERDITPFLIYIKRILVSNEKQSVRSFCLLFLVQKGLDMELDFLHIDKVIKVNPKHLHPPFVGDDFLYIRNKMQETYRDTSLVDNAIQLLSTYLIYIYPEEVDLYDPLLIEAMHIIGAKYLQIPYTSPKEKECEKYLKDINEALENF